MRTSDRAISHRSVLKLLYLSSACPQQIFDRIDVSRRYFSCILVKVVSDVSGELGLRVKRFRSDEAKCTARFMRPFLSFSSKYMTHRLYKARTSC